MPWFWTFFNMIHVLVLLLSNGVLVLRFSSLRACVWKQDVSSRLWHHAPGADTNAYQFFHLQVCHCCPSYSRCVVEKSLVWTLTSMPQASYVVLKWLLHRNGDNPVIWSYISSHLVWWCIRAEFLVLYHLDHILTCAGSDFYEYRETEFFVRESWGRSYKSFEGF